MTSFTVTTIDSTRYPITSFNGSKNSTTVKFSLTFNSSSIYGFSTDWYTIASGFPAPSSNILISLDSSNTNRIARINTNGQYQIHYTYDYNETMGYFEYSYSGSWSSGTITYQY